jgi:hypothetical protein
MVVMASAILCGCSGSETCGTNCADAGEDDGSLVGDGDDHVADPGVDGDDGSTEGDDGGDPGQRCQDDSCSGHGECADDGGVVVCACHLGFTGNRCEACADGFHREQEDCVWDDGIFGLIVPEGSRRCRYAPDYDAWDVIERKARVSLQAGHVRIDPDLPEFPLDWELVGKLELAPDGREAQSLGPGVFWRTVYTQPDSTELYSFDYEQVFEDQGDVFQVIVRVNFNVVDGKAEEPVKPFEDAFVLFGEGSGSHRIEKCAPDGVEGYTVCTANGDRIVLAVWSSAGQQSLDLAWAEFARGSEQRFVDDFFRLAYGYHHHNFSPSHLIDLSEPLYGIHRLLMPPNVNSVQYFNESQILLEEQPIVTCDR